MANRKENLKSLFSNTRTRVIIVFTAVLLIVAILIGYIKLRTDNTSALSSEVSGAPTNIRSIPGVLDPTAQYAQLQSQQNVNQAQTAETTGGSAIPTIIRTQSIGDGVGVIGSQSGVGFLGLQQEQEGGPQQSLWIQTLQNSNCSKSTIQTVVNQGAQISDLKAACSCIQLKDNGYNLKDLEGVCACKELKSAGYNARQLKDIGYSAGRLRDCGFDACELRNAGFTAQEMKDGGFSDGELKGAGFSDDEIARASGLPDGITAADVLKAGCNADALSKLRQAGVSASAIRRISGCSAAQLKAAGFSAQQLKDAGFTPEQLRAAGYTARDLLNAGYTPAELANAGYSAAQIKAAEAELPPGISAADVKNAGCNVDELKREREAGVSATLIKQYAGCSAAALKAAGFSNADLANAGFSPQQISAANLPVSDDAIKAAGCDPNKLKQLFAEGVSATRIKELNGCSAAALRAAGFDARSLIDAGFTPEQLLAAGFSPQEISAAQKQSDDAIKAAGCDPAKLKQLFAAGVSAKRIKALNGCSAQALKDAGFSAKSLLTAGFTPDELKSAGFTADQINAALNPMSDDAIRAAGCDPNKLKQLFAAGVSASRIKDLNGCSAQALKDAGFDAKSLLAAGFTPAQLLAVGFTPQQISAAESPISDEAVRAAGCDPAKLKQLFANGVSAARIKQLNGCSAQALKDAGYDAKSLLDAGFTPAQLLAAGFTAKQLEDSGVNPADIIAAGRTADCSPAYLQKARAEGLSAATIKQTLGCSAAALKAAGYTAKELKDAGFTAAELRNAGFSAADLKKAGYTAKELKDAGFSAAELKDAGFSAKDLKDAGFSASDLKAAGFSAAQLKAAGFSAQDLKDAGYSAAQLKAAGYSAKDLKDAGYSAAELKNAGYTNAELASAGFSPADSSVAGLGSPNINQANSNVAAIPSIAGSAPSSASTMASNAQQLQSILSKQNEQMAEQKYQQKIQQRSNDMVSAANTLIQSWKEVSTQSYTEATETGAKGGAAGEAAALNAAGGNAGLTPEQALLANGANAPVAVKMGDILFAIMDTAVNSDEPGPILATIVTGRFKGAKLIGSFNLPSNANSMVITFNSMSIPGSSKTISISAFAIDPNTARTALSSRTDHHYMMRYGSLFASSFLQGFGNAFQSANTTVTIGGTGGGNNITVQNGIGRSALENAVIGLAQVGQNWGQAAQQLFNTPVTVEVYAGTGIGVLFTQDVSIS